MIIIKTLRANALSNWHAIPEDDRARITALSITGLGLFLLGGVAPVTLGLLSNAGIL